MLSDKEIFKSGQSNLSARRLENLNCQNFGDSNSKFAVSQLNLGDYEIGQRSVDSTYEIFKIGLKEINQRVR